MRQLVDFFESARKRQNKDYSKNVSTCARKTTFPNFMTTLCRQYIQGLSGAVFRNLVIKKMIFKKSNSCKRRGQVKGVFLLCFLCLITDSMRLSRYEWNESLHLSFPIFRLSNFLISHRLVFYKKIQKSIEISASFYKIHNNHENSEKLMFSLKTPLKKQWDF